MLTGQQDPLGITYNNPNYEGLSGLNEFSSEFTFASNNESTYPTELPCQPKDHSNVFAHQPTIQCKEPMPTTQRDPSSILIQCPAENVDAKEDYPWSPASFVSEFSLPSVRHSRASSCSFPLLQHSRNNAFPLPSNPQFTPQRHSTPECIGRTSSTWTPRHRDTSASPPSSGARSSKKRHSSPTPRFFTPIAPNLVGFQQVAGSRRGIGDDDTEWPSLKRQKSMISLPSPHTEVSEEDKWLLKLKDEDGLSWRDIQAKFSEEKGKEYHIPALQMRIKRLRDRMRVWSEGDVQALKLAHQFWTENKFEIIASKVGFAPRVMNPAV